MPKMPKISDAEWDVMHVVWQRSPVTALDVAEALELRTDWNARTVKTLLSRLVAKGVLTYDVQGNRYRYRPKVSREACLAQASQSFLERVFLGNSKALVAYFADHMNLTPKDLTELRRMLSERDRRAGEPRSRR